MASPDPVPQLLVSAFVVSSSGLILLTSHAPYWKWHLPDGDVRFGEKLTETLLRSFHEDFGITLRLRDAHPRLVTQTVNAERGLHFVTHHFRAEKDAKLDAIAGCDELRVAWCDPRARVAHSVFPMLQSTVQALAQAEKDQF